MPQKQITIVIIAALLSASLFLVVLIAQLDFIFMFISTLPLFSLGFGKQPKMALEAGALATLPIALLTQNLFPPALFFFVFALPCAYICRMLLRYQDIKFADNLPVLRIWYPVGMVGLDLAVYGCVSLAIITAIFATQDTNLPQTIMQIIQSEITEMSKRYEINLQIAVSNLAFMLCGFLAWIWAITLLAHAWVANSALSRKNLTRRPSIAVTPFLMPHWVLSLMGICALASLIGGESMRFLGKTCLLILLMPYFLQGASLLHIYTRNWPNRRLFLFFVYAATLLLLWPALILAGAGIWNHIKILNKHLSSGGSSSKS
jgi:hypothetical protein